MVLSIAMNKRKGIGGKGKVGESTYDEKTGLYTRTESFLDGSAPGADGAVAVDAVTAGDSAAPAAGCESPGSGEVDSVGDSTGDAVGDVQAPTIASPPAWKGSTAMSEIDHRQATRKRIAREAKMMTPPVLGDTDSIKEYAKDFRKKNEEYLDACYLIDYDLDRYKRAFRLACEAIATRDSDGSIAFHELVKKVAEREFAQADEDVPLGAHDREKLDKQREQEESEARKAEAKKSDFIDPKEGEQLKIDGLKTKVKGDDGSIAEAATDCVVRPLEEGEDLAAPKDADEPTASTQADSGAEPAGDQSSEDDGFDALFVEAALELGCTVAQEPLTEEQQKEWDELAAANSKAVEEGGTVNVASTTPEQIAAARKAELRQRRLAARRGG